MGSCAGSLAGYAVEQSTVSLPKDTFPPFPYHSLVSSSYCLWNTCGTTIVASLPTLLHLSHASDVFCAQYTNCRKSTWLLIVYLKRDSMTSSVRCMSRVLDGAHVLHSRHSHMQFYHACLIGMICDVRVMWWLKGLLLHLHILLGILCLFVWCAHSPSFGVWLLLSSVHAAHHLEEENTCTSSLSSAYGSPNLFPLLCQCALSPQIPLAAVAAVVCLCWQHL